MKNFRANKSTARDWQRSLFIGSLAEQLGKMDSFRGNLEEEMQDYINEGMNPNEAEELLLAEGYDSDLVKACSSRFVSSKEDSLETFKWGYRIGDNNGRMISHVEMDSVIEASTLEDARGQLEEMISDSGTDASFREIIDVFRIDG